MVQGLVALYFMTFVIPVGIVIYRAPSTSVPVTSSTKCRASTSPIKISSTEFLQDDIYIPRPVIPVYIGYDEQSPRKPPVHMPDTPLPRPIALTAVHFQGDHSKTHSMSLSSDLEVSPAQQRSVVGGGFCFLALSVVLGTLSFRRLLWGPRNLPRHDGGNPNSSNSELCRNVLPAPIIIYNPVEKLEVPRLDTPEPQPGDIWTRHGGPYSKPRHPISSRPSELTTTAPSVSYGPSIRTNTM